MKIRNGFVSNSSSSSFLIMKLGNEFLIGDEDEQEALNDGNYDSNSFTIKIDKLIEKMKTAKENGIEDIYVEYGGGYDG